MSQSREIIIVTGWDETKPSVFIKDAIMSDAETKALASTIIEKIYIETDKEVVSFGSNPHTARALKAGTLNDVKACLYDKVVNFLNRTSDNGDLKTNVYDNYDTAHQLNVVMERHPVANDQLNNLVAE